MSDKLKIMQTRLIASEDNDETDLLSASIGYPQLKLVQPVATSGLKEMCESNSNPSTAADADQPTVSHLF
jgi:hypothetical protein